MSQQPAGTARFVVGRYRLIDELGRGGMGRVWRAHDERLNRPVALKELLLPDDLGADEHSRLADRMRREAQAAAMGAHPSIVTVHDVVEDGGNPWIVMELVSGRSLSGLVRAEGPQSSDWAARWGLSVLAALDTAHGLGILHRDVKPANIMVADDGRAVLTDFGIALIEGSAALTRTSAVVGSPTYLAPERLDLHPATAKSDLWSLGATLWFAVAGTSPFQRADVSETTSAVRSDALPALPVEGSLAAVLEGLLRKAPEVRIDAAEARRLLTLAAGAPDSAESTPLPLQGSGSTAHTDASGIAALSAQPTTGATTPPPHVYSPQPQPSELAAGARGRNSLAWPVAVTVLGIALIAAALAAFLVLVPGVRGNPAATGAEGAGDTGPSHDETAGEQPTSASSSSSPADPGAATAVRSDPAGFDIRVPEGWARRAEGDSVFFDAPDGNTYLQVDLRPHPTDNQVAHVTKSEHGAQSTGRLPEYQRVRIDDVSGQADGATSAADWEFTWVKDGDARHVLTRGMTLESGGHATVAWATSEAEWERLGDLRDTCVESFATG